MRTVTGKSMAASPDETPVPAPTHSGLVEERLLGEVGVEVLGEVR